MENKLKYFFKRKFVKKINMKNKKLHEFNIHISNYDIDSFRLLNNGIESNFNHQKAEYIENYRVRSLTSVLL